MTTTIQTPQILVDGPRNVVVKYEGTLTATEAGVFTIVDPALLSDMDINGVKASNLSISKITYDVEDLLCVNLLWGSDSTNKVIWNLTGRGKVDAHFYGGLQQQDTVADSNGKIVATFDYSGSTGALLAFTLVLELEKQ